MSSTSPWFTSVADQRRYPSLTTNIKTDAVVIGGGIVGILTAWRLMSRGLKVVLLEKNHVATGDTGYTTGFITRIPDTSLSGIATKHSHDFLRQLLVATGQAQKNLIELIQQEHIDCDFVSASSYEISYQADDPDILQTFELLRAIDPSARLLSKAEAQAVMPTAQAAVEIPHEGSFDVREFIFDLLQRPGAKALKIFEETEALSVTGTGRLTVKTGSGSVEATYVVMTTGYPAGFLPDLGPLVRSCVTQVITADYSKGHDLPAGTFWDTEEPYNYFRRLSPQTVMLGGADRSVTSPQTAATSPAQLKKFLEQHLPGEFSVTNEWTGSLFDTADQLPYVDVHPAFNGHLYFATGFSGNGMVMGSLAAQVLADAITKHSHPAADLLKTKRNNIHLGEKKNAAAPTVPTGSSQPWWRWLMPVVYLAVIFWPVWMFWSGHDGLLTRIHDLHSFSIRLFPLGGLLAFTLVWAQIMIGSNMRNLRRYFPWIERYHRWQGPFALLFALTHSTLLLVGVGWATYLDHSFISPSLVPYLYFGYLQISIILLTAGTAMLMKLPWLKKRWHYIHFLNYLLFISVWIHSWFLGSDVQSTELRWLWMFLGVTFLITTVKRFWPARQKGPAKESTPQNDTYVRVASTSDVANGTFCATVAGKTIALFKVDEKYFAIDNACSHAGGPLCEGLLDGKVIECPLHGSTFDVTTGQVLSGPARENQRGYKIRVEGDNILIALP